MIIDKAIKVIIGYCMKHTSCFETDNTAEKNITTKCRFYSERIEDCVLKQCPCDWRRGEE